MRSPPLELSLGRSAVLAGRPVRSKGAWSVHLIGVPQRRHDLPVRP